MDGELGEQDEARRQGRLLELTATVMERAAQPAETQERARGLLFGVLTLSNDLDILAVADRIVLAAADVVDGVASLRECAPDNPGIPPLGVLSANTLEVPIRLGDRWHAVLQVSSS